jgi:hypothetical protein
MVIKNLFFYGSIFDQEPTLLKMLLVMFGPPLLSIPVIIWRLKKGHDVKLVVEWQEKKQVRAQEKRNRYRSAVEEFSILYYRIVNIVPSLEKLGYFTVYFAEPVKYENSDDVRPDIRFGNIAIPFKPTGECEVFCNFEKGLKADMEKISITCGESSFEIDNPYQMNLRASHLSWQNEGHSHEKLIYIDGDCLPNKVNGLQYAFDLLIKGELRGTFYGSYDHVSDKIVVSISEVSKKECTGKECVLRLSYDKRIKAILPQPQVFVTNSAPPRTSAGAIGAPVHAGN